MALTVNRLAILTLLYFSISATASSCEIERGHIATFYSSSCSLEVTSSHTTEAVFLQFKFSGRSFFDVVSELEVVQKKFTVDVAAHQTEKGYRLLLGPVGPQKISYFTQRLKSLGYNSVLVKTVPQGRTVNMLTSAGITSLPNVSTLSTSEPSSSIFSPSSANTESTFVKMLGEVAQRKLLAIMDSDARLIRVTYQNALQGCAAIDKTARIANQDEYVALLSSEQALQIFGSEHIIPFWLDKKRVMTHLEGQVQQRKAATEVHYSVICSVDNKE